jgi:hypothetical protein
MNTNLELASDAHLSLGLPLSHGEMRSLDEGSQGALDYLLIFLTVLVIVAVAALSIVGYERAAENLRENAENLR